MKKHDLKELFRQYIRGTGKDRYRMPNGKSWDSVMKVFAFGLTEQEREAIRKTA